MFARPAELPRRATPPRSPLAGFETGSKEALLQELAASAPGRVRFGEPMRLHTTFHIGGPADVWAEPGDEEELRRLLRIAGEGGLALTAVGGGANLLVRDEGIPGLVIHLAGAGFQGFEPGPDGIWVGAALPLEWLMRRAEESGLSGVEFLAGVPGRVAGAVRMNAGTHDDKGTVHSFSDVLRAVRVMGRDGAVRVLRREELRFRYRSCELDGQIVLGACLRLSPDSRREIAERVRRLREFKKRTQDWSAPSVGCIFKNPAQKSAGWLIDQAGLKGYRVGGAQVSSIHANFIMNVGQAAASDVLAVIEEARGRVLRKFGVELELEVKVLP